MNKVEKISQKMVEKYLNTIIEITYINTKNDICIKTGYMTHKSAVRCAINSENEIIDKLKEHGIVSEFENEVLNKLRSYEK